MWGIVNLSKDWQMIIKNLILLSIYVKKTFKKKI